MAIFHLATIAEDDFKAFRRLMDGNFPNTYQEWLQLRFNQGHAMKAQGYEIVAVEVSSDEFARYCNATGAKGNVHSLRGFAIEKASGKQY
jgi:hypothetical protein